jgi:CRISPR-associated protein Cas5d
MRSKSFEIDVTGELAVFTRPELKVERMSYEVMTPSAARGVLEAVLWKPAIAWHIEQIGVLEEIRWISFRRNEVTRILSAGSSDPMYADENRAQRNTVALKNVGYRVKAFFEMTPKAGDADNVAKFEEMFQRRIEKGQCFHQPYLGCREFAANVVAVDGARRPIGLTKPLGLIFYDFQFRGSTVSPRPLFFHARLEQGVMRVPPLALVLSENGVN